MSDLLVVENLTKIFGERNKIHAVDNVSFRTPERPSIFNIVGESGSGKTTIARIILGLEKATSGSVLYKGININTMDKKWQIQFRREVQPVFQDPYSVYNPIYKIERVFYVPLRKFGLYNGKAKAHDLIYESLRAVDLSPEEVLGKYPHQLSGGQRQRVMLARLHLIRPKLVIADEPVSMIDAGMRASFLNILLDFRDQYGISTLFITHDLSIAHYLGDEIIVLYRGRIIERGKTVQIIKTPLHPYSQLLISSIPVANPDNQWNENIKISPKVDDTKRSGEINRCLYAERCPHVMDSCWKSQPPLKRPQIDDNNAEVQEVACFQYYD